MIGNDEYKTAKLATPANDAGLIADAFRRRVLPSPARAISIRRHCASRFANFSAKSLLPDRTPSLCLPLRRQTAIRRRQLFCPGRRRHPTRCRCAASGRAHLRFHPAARGAARTRQDRHSRRGAAKPVRARRRATGGRIGACRSGRGMAIAFNAAPGTVARDEQGPYGAYATSLTEMIAAGGLSLDDLFARVRLRVSELTKGGEVPWYASQLDGPFFMTERAADAPPPPNVAPLADLRGKPIARLFEHRGRLCGGARARHARRLSAIFGRLSEHARFAAYRRDAGRAPRGDHLAPLCVRQYAAGLLVVSPPLSERTARVGCAPAVDDARRRRSIAPASICLHRFRRAAAAAGGDGFSRPAGGDVLSVRASPASPPPVFFLPVRPREFAVLPPPPAPRERFFLPLPEPRSSPLSSGRLRP